MQVLITGFPRTRTSQLVNSMSNHFKLAKPKNHWGETHMTLNESSSNWIFRENSVFKLWPPFNESYEEILNSFNGIIIVNYINDIPLFVAKLLRSIMTVEWGTDLREIEKISFSKSLNKLQEITPMIQKFIYGVEYALNSDIISKKTASILRDTVKIDNASTIDPNIVIFLREFAKSYLPNDINLDKYVSDGKEELVDYVKKNIITILQ
jgi:hypothetical protein